MIVPIAKEGQDLGTAFTMGNNNFDLTLTPKQLDGFTSKYIKIDGKVANNTLMRDINYTEVDKSQANAILLSKDVIEAGKSHVLYFDFVVNNDLTVENGDFNAWRNNFEYTLDGFEQYGSGSFVAAEVATCEVKGTIFEDTNGNNRKDEDEPAMPNVSVVVKDS